MAFAAQFKMEIISSSPRTDESEDRPFECPQHGCCQRFKRKFTLKEHLKTHTGEKPFVCPVKSCCKTFTTSGNLARHKRLHPWLKPQACLVDGCGRSFSNEAKLESHMKTHFKGPRVLHACTVAGCDKHFSTTGNLTRHVKQQHSYGEVSDASSRDACGQVHSPCSVEDNKPWQSQFATSAFRFDVSTPNAARAFDPLVNEISDVNDEELLETLQCLF